MYDQVQNYWLLKALTFVGLHKPGPADPSVFSETDDEPPFNLATDEDIAPEDGDCGTASARGIEDSVRGSFIAGQDHLGLDHRAS